MKSTDGLFVVTPSEASLGMAGQLASQLDRMLVDPFDPLGFRSFAGWALRNIKSCFGLGADCRCRATVLVIA